ncbi:hypothetical protein AAG906_012402 [Vitis piasezkii]
MMAEGRNEEAKEMRHRNSPLKMNTTINWAEVHDTRDLVKIVLSRVIEKLYVVRIQEPAVLVGVEEDVQWIQRKLMRVRVSRKAKQNRKLGELPLIIRIHKKLELVKSKILALPRLPIIISTGANHDNYFEERVWSDILIHHRSVANTIVSPVEQKVSALLAQEVIHPHTKKKVMRVLDRFRSLNDFLAGLQSVELDACGMVWMEELSHVALVHKRSWMRPSRDFFAFGKLKSEDKLAMEMDKIYAKIQNLSMHRPTEFSRQSQKPNLASFTDDVHAMVKRLLTDDKSFRAVPIMGMEGIGKTTLAKLIFNNKDVLNHFPFGVWTSDGYEFHLRDKEKLMDSNLSQLGDVWNYHVESLIVLDDTHIPFLDHVLTILAESSNGSRMILTTHKISLPPNFQTKSDPHLLRLRGDEEKALSHKDATIEVWSTVLQQFHHDQQQLCKKIDGTVGCRGFGPATGENETPKTLQRGV